jgi:signal transduction histidine kinase
MTESAFAPRILVIDDEPANVRLLELVLRDAGWTHVRSTTDPRQAAALHAEFRSDLVLLDLMMPHLDGLAVMKALRSTIADGEFLPIVILTADATSETKLRALDAGATDFLTKPLDRVEVVLRIKNLLRTRRLSLEREERNRTLEATVRERTEQLLQSEKVATMGSLLAGVAHELNNPLAIVMGQAHMLREVGADGSAAVRAEKINTAAARCVRIVRNFLALARKRPPERTEVVLNQVIAEALELLAYELRSDGIEVTTTLADNLPRLSADAHQLHQVLVNLLTNAHHAMKKTDGPKHIAITSRFDVARGRAQVAVADTGPGIPPEIQQKVFEPFFTTKPLGQGTGLGLSLCRGIVEQHGGTVTLTSAPGRGTTFLVELPSMSAPATTAGAVEVEAPRVASKTILVVDDEEEISELVGEMLRRDGHTAHLAPNGGVALEMLAQRSYDLILSDTKMPILDGLALYREIERRFPALRGRVIFVTGDVLDEEKQQLLAATGAPVITKPFSLNDVRVAVRRRLADTDASRSVGLRGVSGQ